MRPASEVVVTLTPSLWRELRRQAAALDVPIEWLIAGLVCDTVERPGVRNGSRPSPCPATDRSPAGRRAAGSGGAAGPARASDRRSRPRAERPGPGRPRRPGSPDGRGIWS